MNRASSVDLLLRWRDGNDADAMAEFWDRKHDRITALLRARLSPKLRRRVDPDDLAQSAFGSFCVGLRERRINIEAGDNVWQLLAAIALHKLYRRVAFENAARRSLDREESLGGDPRFALARAKSSEDIEAGPAELLAAKDELEKILSHFLPAHRRMIELSLEGHGTADIGKETSYTDRTVRNVLAAFQKELKRRCAELAAS
jgi:hypothetical protein